MEREKSCNLVGLSYAFILPYGSLGYIYLQLLHKALTSCYTVTMIISNELLLILIFSSAQTRDKYKLHILVYTLNIAYHNLMQNCKTNKL